MCDCSSSQQQECCGASPSLTSCSGECELLQHVSVAATGEEAISRTIDVAKKRPGVRPEDIDDVYDVSATAEWIKENGFERVYLPRLSIKDELLGDSPRVAYALEQKLKMRPYILADTSYGSCCVDEIAAEHVQAQCIVHYGLACLTKPSGRIPLKLVFERLPVDLERLRLSIRSTSFMDILADAVSEKHLIVLLVDLAYHYVYDDIFAAVENAVDRLKRDGVKLLRTSLNLPADSSTVQLNAEAVAEVQRNHVSRFGRLVENVTEDELSGSSAILYVGTEGPLLTNFMLAYPASKFISYDTEACTWRRETRNVNQILRKRLFLVEKVKDARIIGIVIGTLGVASYLDVLARTKALINQSGRKCYVFSVGKINVPKLSNFPEVEIFVMISCPFNQLIFDSSDFYRPIVTPFELEVALSPASTWMANSGWRSDITDLTAACQSDQSDSSRDETNRNFSLVTGKIRCVQQPDELDNSSGTMLARAEALQLQAYSAGDYFAERSWRGLEERLGETPVEKASEGRRGIASAYEDETSS